MAQQDAGDGQVSNGHALVIAQHVSAGQRIIEHAGRNVPLPKRVVVHRTHGPEQAAAAFAGGKGCGRKVAENEGEYVLFESLHAAGSDTPRVKTIGQNRESSACNLSPLPHMRRRRTTHRPPPTEAAEHSASSEFKNVSELQ